MMFSGVWPMAARVFKKRARTAAAISSLRLALGYPRISLILRPSSARANLFAGD
jgi:hypothetical protein